jgi:hypothetical protein
VTPVRFIRDRVLREGLIGELEEEGLAIELDEAWS